MRTANSFIHTSADDCRISLQSTRKEDLPMLREALAGCQARGYQTKIKHLVSRIRTLERE